MPRIRTLRELHQDAQGGIDIAVDALADMASVTPLLNPFSAPLIIRLEELKVEVKKWESFLGLKD